MQICNSYLMKFQFEQKIFHQREEEGIVNNRQCQENIAAKKKKKRRETQKTRNKMLKPPHLDIMYTTNLCLSTN